MTRAREQDCHGGLGDSERGTRSGGSRSLAGQYLRACQCQTSSSKGPLAAQLDQSGRPHLTTSKQRRTWATLLPVPCLCWLTPAHAAVKAAVSTGSQAVRVDSTVVCLIDSEEAIVWEAPTSALGSSRRPRGLPASASAQAARVSMQGSRSILCPKVSPSSVRRPAQHSCNPRAGGHEILGCSLGRLQHTCALKQLQLPGHTGCERFPSEINRCEAHPELPVLKDNYSRLVVGAKAGSGSGSGSA